MAININQLIELVIRPALKQMNAYSAAAEQLVAGTAAKESACGFYLHQIKGPALSIYQVEPETYDNLWNQFLTGNNPTRRLILGSCGYISPPGHDRLVTDLMLATMMCRAKYLWITSPLPNFGDINGQANYWDKYYNGNPVKGFPKEYIESYNQYVGGYYAR